MLVVYPGGVVSSVLGVAVNWGGADLSSTNARLKKREWEGRGRRKVASHGWSRLSMHGRED
jgi:hypothetical protein